MKIILAQPRGFCAGVVRAIDIVERALAKHGAPVYVRHEIVHNRHVVKSLKAKGARFVETLKDVPAGAVTIFSAHGVRESVEEEAKARSLPTIDATCPLVTKVHNQGRGYIARGRVLVFIGHDGHPEVEGTLGQIDGEVHLVEDEEDVGSSPSIPPPQSLISPRRHSASTTRGASSRLCIAASATSSVLMFATFVTRRRIDRPPCANSVSSPTSSLSSAPQQLQLQPAARNRGRGRDSELSCRRQQRNRPGIGSRRRRGRRDRRYLAPEVVVEEVVQALSALAPSEVSVLDGPAETVSFRLPAELRN